MCGITIKWQCEKCKLNMTDKVGAVAKYIIDGKEGFIMMQCDSCGEVSYVNPDTNEIILANKTNNIDFSGVTMY